MKISPVSQSFFAVLLVVLGVGCGDDDVTPPPGDMGRPLDFGPVDGGGGGGDMDVVAACAGMPNGATCDIGAGVEQVCISEVCVPSACGDAFADTRIGEACDDGNTDSADGCESDCTFSCAGDGDCSDGEDCNGAETCVVATHLCMAGTPLAAAAACTRATGGVGECSTAGLCIAAGCGNGAVGAGEDCDDGNTVDGDGCDNDCTFSCAADGDCDDGDLCDGVETCTLATHVCATGTVLVCDDASACTVDSCDAAAGCLNALTDADGDGAAPASAGACGTDCDDTNPAVFTGAAEPCDGVDNDCNGMIDEAAPTWYVDCDGDTFAASTRGSVTACAMPARALTGCPPRTASTWTSTVPTDTTNTDCYDANALVRPTQTTYQTIAAPGRAAAVDFDYDCDVVEEQLFTTARSSSAPPLSCGPDRMGTGCIGQTYWVVMGAVRPPAPACGALEQLSECARNRVGVCTRTQSATIQRCL